MFSARPPKQQIQAESLPHRIEWLLALAAQLPMLAQRPRFPIFRTASRSISLTDRLGSVGNVAWKCPASEARCQSLHLAGHHAVVRGIRRTPWQPFVGRILVKRIGYLGADSTRRLVPQIRQQLLDCSFAISLQGTCTPQSHPESPILSRI